MKMKFSANKIYYNFSQENPKSTNIQNPHRLYIGTLIAALVALRYAESTFDNI